MAKKLLTVNACWFFPGKPFAAWNKNSVWYPPGAHEMLNEINGALAFIDIILSGADETELPKKLLFENLDRIQSFDFKLRIEKCEFGKEILFCGHVVDGVRSDSSKKHIPRLEDSSQLRCVIYYGKFIKSIKTLCGFLDELTQKDMKFE